jgi:hypothetical protein
METQSKDIMTPPPIVLWGIEIMQHELLPLYLLLSITYKYHRNSTDLCVD